MENLARLFFLSLLLTVSMTAFAQTGQPADVTVTTPDRGVLEGSHYTNNFFGMSVSVPPSWVVVSAQRSSEVTQDVRKTITGDQQQLKQLDDSINRSITLLSLTKLPAGQPDNASIVLAAEKIPSPKIKSPADVLRTMENMKQGTTLVIERLGEIQVQQIGGAEFAISSFKTTLPAITVTQKVYVTVKNGYALELFFTYLNEKDLPTLDSLVQTIKVR